MDKVVMASGSFLGKEEIGDLVNDNKYAEDEQCGSVDDEGGVRDLATFLNLLHTHSLSNQYAHTPDQIHNTHKSMEA